MFRVIILSTMQNIIKYVSSKYNTISSKYNTICIIKIQKVCIIKIQYMYVSSKYNTICIIKIQYNMHHQNKYNIIKIQYNMHHQNAISMYYQNTIQYASSKYNTVCINKSDTNSLVPFWHYHCLRRSCQYHVPAPRPVSPPGRCYQHERPMDPHLKTHQTYTATWQNMPQPPCHLVAK